MSRFIHIGANNISVDERGFVRIDIVDSIKNTITPSDAEQVCEAIYELAEGKRMPVLTNGLQGKDVYMEPGVREVFASNQKLGSVRTAEAFVVPSLSTRLMINFYMKFNAPSVPTRAFNDEASAVRWIMRYVMKEKG